MNVLQNTHPLALLEAFVGELMRKGCVGLGGELLSHYSLVEHGHGVTLLCCFVLAAGRFLHALKWPDGSRY